VAGNWKMNGLLAQLDEVAAIDALAASHPAVDVALCVPATLIAAAAGRARHCAIGGQDCHVADSGAHTGCIAAPMLAEAGARLTIVGHSERRAAQGETDAMVKAKAEAARRAGLAAILCVGETAAERDAGDAEARVAAMLAASLPDGAAGDWLAIAYEPVWAIGTGRTPTPAEVQAMHAALRAVLAERLGPVAANAVRIVYGGSMTGANAAALIALPDVDGGLVGGASLTAGAFAPIVAAAG
jgi:triosephosphate isomerase